MKNSFKIHVFVQFIGAILLGNKSKPVGGLITYTQNCQSIQPTKAQLLKFRKLNFSQTSLPIQNPKNENSTTYSVKNPFTAN